jgi:hypothetical protein
MLECFSGHLIAVQPAAESISSNVKLESAKGIAGMEEKRERSADQPEYLNDRDAAEDRSEDLEKEAEENDPNASESPDRERQKERVISSVISKTVQH